MGGICPCLIRSKSSTQKSSPYDAHQTFEIQQNLGSMPIGTKQNFHMLVEQPASGNTITKESISKNLNSSKGDNSASSNEEKISSKVSSKISSSKGEQEEIKQDLNMAHKTSTKSLIRKRLHESLAQNDTEDEILQNLEKARKVVTRINNPKREIRIKSCRKSTIFIFDTSESISIQSCSDCFIFCAPCSGKISIMNCKQMRFALITSKIEIRKSKYCEISLFTNNPSRISGCSEICFSNFLRVGYYDLIEQFANCNLEVWNNKFLEVEDIDQNPDEQHYSQKKLHNFDIDWQNTLEEGRIQEADPTIPLFWGDAKYNKKKQILVMNQPMREIQLKLLRYVVSNNVCIQKAYKGILTFKGFAKMKKLFPHHEENTYLCLMVGKELESSGFEAYFETIYGKDVEEIEEQLFPSVQD